MCGRFSLATSYEELVERFEIENKPQQGLFEGRYNIAPGQKILIIPSEKPRRFDLFDWGLVPHWAKNPKDVQRMINARSESIFEKPFFKKAANSQRCLVPADGFFEWKKASSGNIPFRITLKSKEVFAIAGIYDYWEGQKGESLNTCAILTSAPNDLMKKIHNRMPVILSRSNEEAWLDLDAKQDLLEKMFVPFDASKMEAVMVSKAVNNPRNDDPGVIQAVS